MNLHLLGYDKYQSMGYQKSPVLFHGAKAILPFPKIPILEACIIIRDEDMSFRAKNFGVMVRDG